MKSLFTYWSVVGGQKVTPPEWYFVDLERISLRVKSSLSLLLILTLSLCGCCPQRPQLSGTYVNTPGDELIHICPDRNFVMTVPDFDVITGVSELISDTTLALYYMDGSDTLAVDTFVVRYSGGQYELTAPRTHECFKELK